MRWVERVRLGGRADRVTHLLTRISEHGLLWYGLAMVAAALSKRRERKRWVEAAGAVAGSYAVGSTVKIVARRGRPPLAGIATGTRLSFPSLHAATSTAAARTFTFLLPWRAARLAVHALAVACTASRIHFCVHYPSDIAAGAAVGDLVGRATVRRWLRQDQRSAAAEVRGAPRTPAAVPVVTETTGDSAAHGG